MPDTKVCPDCAETVLAAARKCRFCGYRFDQPRPGATRGLLERLGLWRPQRMATFDEVLADWGIAIGAGEETASFRIASVDSQRGYLLVTNERMLFIADHRRNQSPVFEHPLGHVWTVRVARRKHQLTVHGAGFEHVVHVGSQRAVHELSRAFGTDG